MDLHPIVSRIASADEKALGQRMLRICEIITAAVVCGVLTVNAAAQNKDPRPALGIQDNSFLIEEAYNQEAGVVQHINGLRRQRGDWFYTFTQEWPLGSQAHQFSYTLPYSWMQTDLGQRVQGLGDAMINYRYQALMESNTSPAFAPRLSLIVPSGNKDNGTGTGSAGIQIDLPFSKVVTDRMTLHANAGMTQIFEEDGFHPTSYNIGGSAIYALSRDFNLMLESLAEWDASVTMTHELEREFIFTISPGFRYALNFPKLADLQIVLGAAIPVGFMRGKDPDYGAFFYLSFEHNFERLPSR